MREIKLLTTLALICSSQFILAQGIVTDRPDQTESSSTVQKGKIQIETGILVEFREDDLISERQLLLPTTLFRLGVSRTFEIRVLSQLESVEDQNSATTINGISDIELGTKIQLVQKDNVNTEMAFISHLVIPTGSKQLSNDKFGTINKLSISHELDEKIALGYNVGYNYLGFGDGDLTYSMALGYSLSDTIGLYIEPYGEVINLSDHEANFDAGITYLLKSNFQLDFSFGAGINHNMNYMSVGCSFIIPE